MDRRHEAHPLAVAAIRLLTLTGARLSEILHLRRDAIEDGDDEDASVRLGDSKTGPRTIWFGVREDAGLPGLRLHDCRHTFASQGVMNGVGLTTVGKLLGQRRRECTAIYAHLDDTALQAAAAQAAAVVARAMDYRAEPSSRSGSRGRSGGHVCQSVGRSLTHANAKADPFALPLRRDLIHGRNGHPHDSRRTPGSRRTRCQPR